MRMGVMGVGRIGALHTETLHSLGEVEELTIVDVDTARARQIASSMGVFWAEDAEALLYDGVDGLVIATPPTPTPVLSAPQPGRGSLSSARSQSPPISAAPGT
jgi:myo-inositol 2-dehydrogenase/D-chiro-inositol 1-dehydrogenase